jgi:hypothetical protein
MRLCSQKGPATAENKPYRRLAETTIVFTTGFGTFSLIGGELSRDRCADSHRQRSSRPCCTAHSEAHLSRPQSEHTSNAWPNLSCDWTAATVKEPILLPVASVIAGHTDG